MMYTTINSRHYERTMMQRRRAAIQGCIAASMLLASLSVFLSRPHVWMRSPLDSFTSPPPQSTKDTNWAELSDLPESFSSCLLIMDDNHRLSEWIAYHYYALPLRYLVVTVDPASKTSPTPILDRWRERGMTIVEWADENVVKSPESIKRLETDDVARLHFKHRVRQNMFYEKCTAHMQSLNRTWTTYIDTDEFLALNGEVVENGEELMGQSGSVLDVIKTVEDRTTSLYEEIVPHFNNSGCVTVPRVFYSAHDSLPEEVTRHVPKTVVDPFRLNTLRYRYHLEGVNGMAKSIVDVSRLPEDAFESGNMQSGNAHRVTSRYCPSPHVGLNAIPIAIQHYLGSSEAYNFRDDVRVEGHNRKKWEEYSSRTDGGANDGIRPWIHGFVDLVGEAEARILLADAGVLAVKPNVVPAASADKVATK